MTSTPDVLPVVERADHVPGPKQGRWDYEHYAEIPEDGNRYEIIDGVLYMAPSPNIAHQRTVVRFTILLGSHIERTGLGELLVAPADVQLAVEDSTVVQPDLFVVLNEHRSMLMPSRVVGAPDLVIEVVSPSTATHDRSTKMQAYARAGVREYWFADPYAHTVELLQLEEGAYHSAGLFQGKAILPSRVIPALPVPVEQFFAP